MTGNSAEEIQNKIIQLEASVNDHKEKLRIRDVLETKIQQLNFEIEKKIFSYYRLKFNKQEDNAKSSTELQKLKEEREILQKNLNQIDKELEVSEECEVALFSLKMQLKECIFQKDPIKKLHYEAHEKITNEKRLVSEELLMIQPLFNEAMEKFSHASWALQAKKNQSLLQLIFGRNRKVVVATTVFQIAQNSSMIKSQLSSLIEKKKHPSQFLILYQKFEDFFLNLNKEVESPWKRQEFEQRFFFYKNHFQDLLKQFENYQTELEKELTQLELRKQDYLT